MILEGVCSLTGSRYAKPCNRASGSAMYGYVTASCNLAAEELINIDYVYKVHMLCVSLIYFMFMSYVLNTLVAHVLLRPTASERGPTPDRPA